MDGDAELSICKFSIQSGLREECALLNGVSTELGLGVVEGTKRDEAARFSKSNLAAREILHATTSTPHHHQLSYTYTGTSSQSCAHLSHSNLDL